MRTNLKNLGDEREVTTTVLSGDDTSGKDSKSLWGDERRVDETVGFDKDVEKEKEKSV